MSKKFYGIDITKLNLGKYQPINTKWLYSYTDIPNLEIIKSELLRLFMSDVPKKQFSAFYVNVYKQDIKDCPALFEYLYALGLLHKFVRVLFSITGGLDINAALPHADSFEPEIGIRYTLNIPLVDAEDSCTIFYDKEIGSDVYYGPKTRTAYAHAMEGLTEIARMYYTQPAILNTSIIHRGEAKSLDRLLAGIRFMPELTYEELSRFGVKIEE
jgi:hypothetical protein